MITDASATVVTGILFLVTFAWISLFTSVLRGNEILAFQPRRATPWGSIAVILSFFLFIGSQLAVGLVLDVDPDAEPTVAQTNSLLTWTAVAILAATFASIGLIHLFSKASQADFGISLDHVRHDLFVGVYAFLIVGPVTFLIQYFFVKLLEFESKHPLIELLREDSTGMLFGVVTVLAVIVAPISEEYFFRVLLQGWLERIFLFRITHDQEVRRHDESELTPPGNDATPESAGSKSTCGMNSPSSPLSTHDLDRSFLAATIPIVVSAAIFALMHWSHGPDPAALFVLALGLGYLYQRTHRWLPCVVMHACLNGATMMMLWFGLDDVPK